jgi:hypothetical protein
MTMSIEERAEKVWINSNGITCAIVHVNKNYGMGISSFGNRFAKGWKCGYVKLTDNLLKKCKSDYDDSLFDEIDIHGGLTYGPDEDGFLGFDDAHGFKLERPIEEEVESLALQIHKLANEKE